MPTISGSLSNDTITSGNADHVILGYEGNDSLSGANGNDTIDGGLGNDTLSGNASNDSIVGGEGDDLLIGGQGLFHAPVRVSNLFGHSTNFTSQNSFPRMLGDVNGDGRADLVAFGSRTWVALGQADGTFGNYFTGSMSWGHDVGWTSQDAYPRMLGDVNGDGRDDLVAFGSQTWVSLGQADGTFGNYIAGSPDFGQSTGWKSQNSTPRMVADVNGDGRADLVGFGSVTWIALGQANGAFGTTFQASPDWAANFGWTSLDAQFRALGDVNGDGRSDLVAFGSRTWVSLGGADGKFAPYIEGSVDFGHESDFKSQTATPRVLADVNGDGRDDIIGFGSRTWVSYGKADGTFERFFETSSQFGANAGWTSQNTHPRMAADVNGDGLADIVAFDSAGTLVALATKDRDTLSGGGGNDTIIGGPGADMMDGGPGIDTLSYRDGYSHIHVDLGTGMGTKGDAAGDVVSGFENIAGGFGNDTLIGDGGDNRLFGDLNADSLVGQGGADTLDGGAGADTLAGGTGNDTFVVDNAGDLLVENAGEGTDTVTTALSSHTLAANLEDLTYAGAGAFQGTGNALANRISGGSGSDTLDGGAGADTLTGGGGNDLYLADDPADQIVELPAGGTDEVRATAGSYTLSADLENLTYTGSGSFAGTGNAAANRIQGGAGNDTLDGAAGSDTLVGGLGDDVYLVDSTADQITENPGQGTDTVWTTLASYTLAATLENLAYIGTGDFAGTGNGLANRITGGAGNDTLDGAAGADTLEGGAGSDLYLIDDAGDAVIEGVGAGTDEVRTALASHTLADNVEILTYTGAASFTGAGNGSGNQITGGALADTLDGGSGSDTLLGGGGADSLLGGQGSDSLDGGSGADTMAGGTGDDTYVVEDAGDLVLENAGEGTDTIRTGLAAYTLGATLERLVYTGSAPFTGTGNAADNQITGGGASDTLDGLDGNDTLSGGGGADSLAGGGGNDQLDGGTGADTLVGGTGNDTYVIDSTGDLFVENPGEGTDTVRTTLASYSLDPVLENLVFIGGGSFTGTGNEAANSIAGGGSADTLAGGLGNDTLLGNGGADCLVGGDGDDSLNGGTGIDTLAGGTGNDTYGVDAATDVVIEQPGEGTDTVRSSVTFSLPDHVEHLVLIGAAVIDGTGNALGNQITGNGAANLLDGGAGADTLTGGGGDDVYLVDDAGDVVVEALGQGTDEVRTGLFSYMLGANLEALAYTGSGSFAGTGNAADNTITGGSGPDTLDGLDGNDSLVGGPGIDRLLGGAGNDTLRGASSSETLLGSGSFGDLILAHSVGFAVEDGNTSFDAYPRALGDVNGDGRMDVIGFGQDNVYVALGQPDGTFAMHFVARDDAFSYNDGNTSQNLYPRMAADVNGDGRDDVVAFGGNDVYVALGQPDGTFGAAFIAHAGHAVSDGWSSQDKYPRGVADVNGDGRADIVGFGHNDTWVSLGQADGTFGASSVAHAGFAYTDGSTSQNLYPRVLADVNGDSRADIVAFGGNDVYVALGQANGTFGSAQLAHAGFAYSDGWSSQNSYPRAVVDVNGDGKADLVGFGGGDTWVALSLGNGTFGTAFVAHSSFAVNDGWSSHNLYPRLVGDVNGDGRADIVGFGQTDVVVALAHPGGDYLVGGSGDDTYIVETSLDVIIEAADGGTDTVQASSAFFQLPTEVEHLVRVGSDAFEGRGNAGDNKLTGGSGSDTLLGGGGNDTLAGGGGADVLTGGAGADRFVIAATGDSTASAPDVVTDFDAAAGDRLDLSGAGSLSWVDQAAFSMTAGELRWQQVGGDVHVLADLDGDGAADLTVVLAGISGLTSAGLIL